MGQVFRQKRFQSCWISGGRGARAEPTTTPPAGGGPDQAGRPRPNARQRGAGWVSDLVMCPTIRTGTHDNEALYSMTTPQSN
jgi:hypothetical protein